MGTSDDKVELRARLIVRGRERETDNEELPFHSRIGVYTCVIDFSQCQSMLY